MALGYTEGLVDLNAAEDTQLLPQLRGEDVRFGHTVRTS